MAALRTPAVNGFPGWHCPATQASPTVQALPSQSLGSHGGRVVEVVPGNDALVVVVAPGADVLVVVVETSVVVVGPLTALIAASASTRPWPATLSEPGASMSTAVDVRMLCTWDGERLGLLLSRRAATAAE